MQKNLILQRNKIVDVSKKSSDRQQNNGKKYYQIITTAVVPVNKKIKGKTQLTF